MIIYESYCYQSNCIWVFCGKLEEIQISLRRKTPTMVIESINNSEDVAKERFSRIEE